MWYVYVLRCGDGSFYTGATTDVEKRVRAHQSGRGAKYTRSHAPVALAYFEEAADKSAALRRENEIKRMTHAEKEALIAR
ncbi:MAG: GIY-YIG nuclease family protein [Oscillibacter sp.]|nr:GIY-YIG nuclease family protein [Oscillibacter sp.]